jgi:hypothetical protein
MAAPALLISFRNLLGKFMAGGKQNLLINFAKNLSEGDLFRRIR